jgi:hypothetical protein
LSLSSKLGFECGDLDKRLEGELEIGGLSLSASECELGFELECENEILNSREETKRNGSERISGALLESSIGLGRKLKAATQRLDQLFNRTVYIVKQKKISTS